MLLADNKDIPVDQTRESLKAAKRVSLEMNMEKTKDMLARKTVFPRRGSLSPGSGYV